MFLSIQEYLMDLFIFYVNKLRIFNDKRIRRLVQISYCFYFWFSYYNNSWEKSIKELEINLKQSKFNQQY